MGRRVLTVHELTFHGIQPHACIYSPANLQGCNLPDIFYKWVTSLNATQTHDHKRQRWVRVAGTTRLTEQVVLVDLRVGSYGEGGELVDITTGNVAHVIGNHEAPTGQNRLALFVPKRGARAYFLSEGSTRGDAGGHIRRLFMTHFRGLTNQIVMEMQAVTEGDVWVEAAKLTEVEIRLEGKAADLADGNEVNVGRISYIAKPKKRAVFPNSMIGKLRSKDFLTKVVGVPDLPEERDVYVTMKRDGRIKKFVLGVEESPTLRQVLNDTHENPLTTEQFVEVCVEQVSALCDRTGEVWDSAWSRP